MLKIITTADGSASLYNTELDETYHSRRGAAAESEYVYIESGLKYLVNKGTGRLNIFEMGFGTGLNAVLTYREFARYNNLWINYTAIEKHPLSPELTGQLVFPGITDDVLLAPAFAQMHTGVWDEAIELHKGFYFTKVKGSMETFDVEQPFNLVYYDAFAPSKQPEVWTAVIFKKIYNMMQQGGVLVTYCASGQFKRTLAQCGFIVETLKGPLGKREMVRALKQ